MTLCCLASPQANALRASYNRSVVCVCVPWKATFVLSHSGHYVMMPLLRLCVQIDAYAEAGLRTLVLGQRMLTETEFGQWRVKFDEANSSMTNRQALKVCVCVFCVCVCVFCVCVCVRRLCVSMSDLRRVKFSDPTHSSLPSAPHSRRRRMSCWSVTSCWWVPLPSRTGCSGMCPKPSHCCPKRASGAPSVGVCASRMCATSSIAYSHAHIHACLSR